MEDTLRIDGRAKQLFHCLDVFGESLAAGFRDAIEGLRLAQHELLFDGHVPGFFKLEQSRAQVAVLWPRSLRGAMETQPLPRCWSSESKARRSLP